VPNYFIVVTAPVNNANCNTSLFILKQYVDHCMKLEFRVLVMILVIATGNNNLAFIFGKFECPVYRLAGSPFMLNINFPEN
jgi:hypothetical protein